MDWADEKVSGLIKIGVIADKKQEAKVSQWLRDARSDAISECAKVAKEHIRGSIFVEAVGDSFTIDAPWIGDSVADAIVSLTDAFLTHEPAAPQQLPPSS